MATKLRIDNSTVVWFCTQVAAVALEAQPLLIAQGSGEQLILDEGRVNKFNKRFASIGSFGQVAPASTGGDKKLEYKVSKASPSAPALSLSPFTLRKIRLSCNNIL